MRDNFAPLFSQSVAIQTPLNYTRNGQVNEWRTPENFPARVRYGSQKITDDNGDRVNVTGEVWILGIPAVSTKDRLVLPDGRRQNVVKVEVITDEDGPHHVKVFF